MKEGQNENGGMRNGGEGKRGGGLSNPTYTTAVSGVSPFFLLDEKDPRINSVLLLFCVFVFLFLFAASLKVRRANPRGS